MSCGMEQAALGSVGVLGAAAVVVELGVGDSVGKPPFRVVEAATGLVVLGTGGSVGSVTPG